MRHGISRDIPPMHPVRYHLIGALDGMEVPYHIGEIKNTSKAAAEKNVKIIEEVLRDIIRDIKNKTNRLRQFYYSVRHSGSGARN